MNRRTIVKVLGITIPLTVGCTTHKSLSQDTGRGDIVKPRRLSSGDTVGIISPGSSLTTEGLKTSIENIESLGYKVKTGKHWDGQYGYLAATDKERLADIHDMFADDEVSAIWCARGGYGCTRLLPSLDYNLISKHPKMLIGYSDITALHNAIFQETGLIGFHGPVASSDFTDYAKLGLHQILSTPLSQLLVENSTEHVTETISPGKASGRIVGGNLSILAAMCGTPYQVDMTDRLVFLEDVGEKPYRIDRMLTQLLQSSGLSQAKGIILGIWKGCEANENDKSLTLRQCFEDRIGGLNIPIAYGFSFGHIAEQFTIPVGALGTLDADDHTLVIEETVVS